PWRHGATDGYSSTSSARVRHRQPPPALRNSSTLATATSNPHASSWRPTRGGHDGMTTRLSTTTELATKANASPSSSTSGSGATAARREPLHVVRSLAPPLGMAEAGGDELRPVHHAGIGGEHEIGEFGVRLHDLDRCARVAQHPDQAVPFGPRLLEIDRDLLVH